MPQAGGWQRLLGSVDAGFRARLVNTGHLLSGSFASALLGLGAVAFTARALGPFDYGVLAMALSFVRAIEQIVTFQSWQALIRYGAPLTGPEHHDALRVLLKFGLALDLGGALIGTALAVGITLMAGPLLGWSEGTQAAVLICCMILPFNLNGMATAVLRLFGRYRLAAYGPAVGSLARMLLCGAGLVMGLDVVGFAIVWTVTQALGALLLLGQAFRVLHVNGVTGVLAAPLQGVGQRFDGLWGFAWSTNLSLAIRSSAYQLDVLVVGALAGPAAAGLFHIVKRAAKVAEQATAHIQTVLYPDVARMWAAGDKAGVRQAVRQVEMMVLGFGLTGTLFVMAAGPLVLRWTAGPAFVAAAPLLVVQMIAVTLMMTGSASRSALLAADRQRQVLNAAVIGTGAFHVTALLLVPEMGAMGASIAHVVMGSIVSAMIIMNFRKVAAA